MNYPSVAACQSASPGVALFARSFAGAVVIVASRVVATPAGRHDGTVLPGRRRAGGRGATARHDEGLTVIRRTGLGLLLLLLLTAGARAGDWPEFRGPTGQGAASGQLPTAWGPDKGVAWKQEIPGQGWSSPVIRDGRVYLTTAASVTGSMPGDISLRALALDAASGKVLWDREVFRQDGYCEWMKLIKQGLRQNLPDLVTLNDRPGVCVTQVRPRRLPEKHAVGDFGNAFQLAAGARLPVDDVRRHRRLPRGAITGVEGVECAEDHFVCAHHMLRSGVMAVRGPDPGVGGEAGHPGRSGFALGVFPQCPGAA